MPLGMRSNVVYQYSCARNAPVSYVGSTKRHLYQRVAEHAHRTGQNEFGRLSQLIGTNIQKISQNVSSVERWVNQLGTHQDSEQLRSQLHQIQHYTNQLAKDTNKHMKDLAHLASVNPSEQKQQKMQKERLTNEFSEALKNFQDCQRKAAQKEKDSVKRARANSGLDGDPFLEDMRPARNDTQLINLASIRMFTLTFPASVKVKAFKIVGIPYSAVKLADLGYNLDYKLTISPPAKFSDLRGHSLLSRNIHRVKLHPLMASLAFTGQRPTEPSQSQMQLQLEEDVNIEALKEREKSIKQLESDIVDVNTIFKDLATMVHEQGDIIDSIEANIDHSTINVQDGTKQLAKARASQNDMLSISLRHALTLIDEGCIDFIVTRIRGDVAGTNQNVEEIDAFMAMLSHFEPVSFNKSWAKRPSCGKIYSTKYIEKCKGGVDEMFLQGTKDNQSAARKKKFILIIIAVIILAIIIGVIIYKVSEKNNEVLFPIAINLVAKN
ncbi:Syntaxin-12 [Nymphon striatum]|nr:Syntaxin-12 [Nymphon striatum]